MRRTVALGLADAMLAGPPRVRSAAARCARVLGSKAGWLAPLARTVIESFGTAWHSGARRKLALAILCSPHFREAWLEKDPPRLRALALQPPRMAPAPAQLQSCALPDLPTVGDIAAWLQLDPREIEWFAGMRSAHFVPDDERLRHYSYHWIEKRSGGHRLLEVPKSRLKRLQQRLLHGLLEYVPPHECAHGFRVRHSCLTNALPHVGRAVVLRFDLEDFFLSVGGARVVALFRTLGYPEGAARVLAGLCTNRVPARVLAVHDPARYAWELPQIGWRDAKRFQSPHLPQGAPTSPALANLCAFRLDLRLQALAESWGGRYTRYADDLTISGGHGLARATERLEARVGAIALEEGFRINHRKTRVMRGSARQMVTGIVVNERPNVKRGEFDRLKATLHNCAMKGPQQQNRSGAASLRTHLAGRIAQLAAIHPGRARRLKLVFDRIAW
jgi:hypothetical protein